MFVFTALPDIYNSDSYSIRKTSRFWFTYFPSFKQLTLANSSDFKYADLLFRQNPIYLQLHCYVDVFLVDPPYTHCTFFRFSPTIFTHFVTFALTLTSCPVLLLLATLFYCLQEMDLHSSEHSHLIDQLIQDSLRFLKLVLV